MSRRVIFSLGLVLATGALVSPAQEEKKAANQDRLKADGTRREPVRRALTWLVEATESKEWDKFQGGNPEAHRYIATLLTAWLLETNSDIPEFEKIRRSYRERVDRQLVDNVAFKFFPTWCDGFAGLYVYERSLRDGKAHPALERIARSIVAEQNREGGWNHTKNFTKTIPGYSPTVLAVANLALISLGAAERMKVPFAAEENFKKSVKDGLDLFRKSQRPNGGIPYGKNPLYGESEPGRTAGFLTALAALQQTDSEQFRKAAPYFLRTFEAVPKGHGCTPMHFFMASMASYILSDNAYRDFDAKVLEQVRQLQRKEGDFNKGPGFTGPGKDLFDKAYTAALYALALSVDRTEVARKLRLSAPFQLEQPPGDKKDPAKTAEAFNKLKSDIEEAVKKRASDLKLAKTPAETDQLNERFHKQFIDHVAKTQALVEASIGDAMSQKIAQFRDQLLLQTLGADEAGEKVLRELKANSPAKVVRALTMLGLSSHLIRQYEKAYQAGNKTSARMFEEEMEANLKQAQAEFGDVKTANSTIAKQAASIANRHQRFSLGKVAAEITGTDLDGKKFKLSDHRGKVVVFYFWGTWCKPCVAQIPHEKELYARMDKKKFTLIGIQAEFNLDRAQAKKWVEDMGMGWTQIWDGGLFGSIGGSWGVNSWPTLYVLDANGVIRYRNISGKALDRAVDELIKELDASKSKTSK